MIRLLDITLSILGLVVSWPLLTVIYLFGLWDTGSPIFRQKRVGRHTSTVLMTMESWTELNPDRPLVCSGVPRYDEVIASGLGHWLKNPVTADSHRVAVE